MTRRTSRGLAVDWLFDSFERLGSVLQPDPLDLGVDSDGAFYWDGKPVEMYRRIIALKRW